MGGALRIVAALVVMLVGARAVAQETMPSAEGVKSQKDIVYATAAGGGALKLDVYMPDGVAGSAKGLPVIVRISPERETPAGPAIELLGKGYALVYAGYLPEGSGHRVVFERFPADLHAVQAAIRWVRFNAAARQLDADRIGLWGADHGATLAALAAVTSDQKELNGTLGDHSDLPTNVRAVCLFGGTTDWRNAELYGDETVNFLGSPAYQLFGGNPKQFPEDARMASAVNYVRPTSPATLMVTLASDSNRAMHLIYAETLRRAGVPSALYEEAPGSGAGLGGRAVDEAKLNRTILQFFGDTLGGAAVPPAMSIEAEVDQLAKAGLYKQARRIIEQQIEAGVAGEKQKWLAKMREISNEEQEPAIAKLAEAIKKRGNAETAGAVEWTLREVLTDPEHIGEYRIEASVPQREFDRRAETLRQVEILNRAVAVKDWAAADQQVAAMRVREGMDTPILNTFLERYNEVRTHPDRVWPQGVKPVGYATAFGQDLYGNWFDIKAGGVMQRFRYIRPGKFVLGSSVEEWGRLPGESLPEVMEVKEGFWLAEMPVRQVMWEGVLGAEKNRSHFRGAGLPEENASYASAVNFLNKLGVEARLPTQTEWEYACRAGSTQPVAGTGRLSDMAWFWDEARNPANATADVRILHELETDRSDAQRSTHELKTKLPNAWGLYDMQGNVWEWCSGTLPEKGRDEHVVRGGSWISIPQSCRAARAAWLPVEEEAWNVGVRILIPAERE